MIKFRQATIDDAKALIDIYAPYITNTTITFEDEIPTVENFQQRIREISQTFPYLVALDEDNKILGYAYAHLYGPRAAYAWTTEASIYVDQNYKGHGLGTTLYQKLEQILKKQHVVNLLACVTEENLNSIKFHEKLGYKQVGTFKKVGFKFGRWLDVTWLQKTLNQRADVMGPIIPIDKVDILE
ncbi:GNAT family N-acetyltransferase [Companilactobacillus halodurans]|uniref:N-acetyltransferase family protein n=1 Tax=Companilactobacillus halodurans TaxID=2584183 RepID=A0A5P0ZRX8_9LACO|nr:GNAT family N-acetyltransferase [Companilactobacillus halodurans]MQS76976.1 N-acetyltransferase family protein [Companilactobacillus halodurans]MQS98620.1 N-acetyltransferase family protein [Companilactobacillus halodurans]